MSEELCVTFWGTRGSIPTPGRLTEHYGGNTTCVEVQCDDTLIILDAGSGIRELGMSLDERFPSQAVNASLLFTHLHWDHIQGFPFFSCTYVPDNRFTIYGADRASGSVQEILSSQMSGDYFPIQISAMQARLDFRTPGTQFDIGPVHIRTLPLPHPGGVLGYRLETAKSVFVFATDCELDAIAGNTEELKENHLAVRQYEQAVLDFFADAHLIVIDCQYTDQMYHERVGWGHNSIAAVVDLCDQVRPEMVSLFHHDPQSADGDIAQMVDETADRLSQKGIPVFAFGAREGLTVKATRSRQPPGQADAT
ncbi:MAG: MBL fold metallo-hydrolase [Planctomycetaceae bacterium]|jgi:phosphoribosyl 1,2-cyclic phosphodiesterase